VPQRVATSKTDSGRRPAPRGEPAAAQAKSDPSAKPTAPPPLPKGGERPTNGGPPPLEPSRAAKKKTDSVKPPPPPRQSTPPAEKPKKKRPRWRTPFADPASAKEPVRPPAPEKPPAEKEPAKKAAATATPPKAPPEPASSNGTGVESQTQGYRPDAGKLTTVRWLAAGLLAITVLGALPAQNYFRLGGAPAWAQLILIVSALQLVYIFWMATLPDWSSVWVLMLVFAVVAALYGLVLAVALVAPPDPSMPLDLYPVRRLAAPWCAAMILLTFLGAYLCGRFSYRWYRSYVLAARGEG
jgi:hypothetical protein